VEDVWQRILDHRERLGSDGLTRKRAHQQLDFAWALVRDELEQRLTLSPAVREVRTHLRDDILTGRLTAVEAADRILAAYDGAADEDAGSSPSVNYPASGHVQG
jgi:LAO/AO transport system kinase